MAKKGSGNGGEPPLWKKLGYQRVTKENGQFLGFYTPQGKYISRRQYDRMQGKPGKGSPGYKERIERGDISHRKREAALKAYAKKPGATLEGYKRGGESEVPKEVFRSQEKHFQAVVKQRLQSINLKYEAGLINREQWSKLREKAWEEDELRRKMANIWEQLDNNQDNKGRTLSNADRERLEKKYQGLKKKYDRAHKKLKKGGVVPHRDSDLEHGYYH